MATPLDTSLLTYLTPIFVFLLVYALLHAMIAKLKIFGTNTFVHATVAFSLSFMLLILPDARNVIAHFTPWLVVLLILTLFIFFFFMALGVEDKSLSEMATKNAAFITFTVAFILVVFLISLTEVFGPFLLSTSGPGFWNATKRTLFHPKVLGAIFILITAAYAVNYLSNPLSHR